VEIARHAIAREGYGFIKEALQPDAAPDGISHASDRPGIARGFLFEQRTAVSGTLQGVGNLHFGQLPYVLKSQGQPAFNQPPDDKLPIGERQGFFHDFALVALEKNIVVGRPGAQGFDRGFGIERLFGHYPHLFLHVDLLRDEGLQN